jgi:hypothetical protein
VFSGEKHNQVTECAWDVAMAKIPVLVVMVAVLDSIIALYTISPEFVAFTKYSPLLFVEFVELMMHIPRKEFGSKYSHFTVPLCAL